MRANDGAIDTTTMMLSNVTGRTNGTPQNLALLPPGDYDPKISPDGTMLTSYRHLTVTPGLFGERRSCPARHTDLFGFALKFAQRG